MQSTVLPSLDLTMARPSGPKRCTGSSSASEGPKTCPETRTQNQKVMKAIRGMNKDQQGFKGEKAQHVDGGHLRFSDTKAFGRKTALHNKYASTYLPSPPPCPVVDNSSYFVWLAPEPGDHKPRAPWFRRSLWLAAFTKTVSHLPPAPQLSTPFYTLSAPLGCPSLPHVASWLASQPPISQCPCWPWPPGRWPQPPPHLPQLFCSGRMWRLSCGGIFLIKYHRIPQRPGKHKAPYSGPRNHL